MILVWSLFNLLLFILILYSFWRVTKLLGQQLGKSTAILFMLGLFAFRGTSSSRSDTLSPNLISEKPVQIFQDGPFITETTRPIGSRLNLNVWASYQPDTSQLKPLSLMAYISGFTGGHKWTPTAGYTNINRDGTFQYHVEMKHEWMLFSSVIWTDFEPYEGTLPKPHKLGFKGTAKVDSH